MSESDARSVTVTLCGILQHGYTYSPSLVVVFDFPVYMFKLVCQDGTSEGLAPT